MGPLAGVKVLEIAGIGAAPYGCMMLADMGAEVVRVDRSDALAEKPDRSPLLRNRRSVVLNLKDQGDREILLALVEKADVLVEGFRPGVMERLGLGPDQCFERNSRLVYARMTGWGQTGPLAKTAGHDLNYIGLTGLLHQIGPIDGKPVVPLNVIGDFGGGGLLMAFGVACALVEARTSGKGQVIDAAMVDGVASFMTLFCGFKQEGLFEDRTGSHILAGGAHYYDVYEAADGKYLSVAAVEPQFYAVLISKIGLDSSRFLPAGYPAYTREIVDSHWPELKAELAAVFKTKARDEWVEFLKGCDACVQPVLSLSEAQEHPHNEARKLFIEVDGIDQPAPAPRFSRTPASTPKPPPKLGADTQAVLESWGVKRQWDAK